MLNRVIPIITLLSALLIFAVISAYADTYTYDPLNRLTRVVYDDGSSIDYTYDAAGNITRIDRTGNSVPVDGVCGGSNGRLFDSAPTTDFCDNGTSSATGAWNWDCVGLYGGGTVSCSAALGYLLTVSVIGDGNVLSKSSVAGVPSDILCSAGTCSAGYPSGYSVSITASPGLTSTFGGWGAPCAANPCNLNMDAAKNFTAAFTPAPKIKLDVAALTGYSTFTDAYANATATLYALQDVLTGDWTLGGSKAIILKGGYKGDYQAQTGYTTIKGKLSVQGGSLRVDKVKIQP